MSVDKTKICQKTCNEFQANPVKNEFNTSNSISKVIHGNLGALGKLWIYTVRSFLVGSTFCNIASCACRIQPSPPEVRTKKIKLSQLSVYDCPPMLEQEQCEIRPVFNYLLPYVTIVRESCQKEMEFARKELRETVNEITNDFNTAGDRIKKYFRDDENLGTRHRLVYAGGIIGYLRPGGLLRRLFFSTLGLTTTGMLCFPKETDQHIRNVSYQTGKAIVKGYYFMTGRKSPDD